jgi:hypothetical protein
MRRLPDILLAIATFALLLWPALVSGYPLLYPDTLDYLGTGRPAWAALATLHHPEFYSVRSAIYAAVIYLFHWNRTPWPVLALNACAVVFAVYLTVRSLVQRDAWRKTLAVLATLSILTGLSWYTSLLMPDIFGAPLYLAVYLFAFARETLRPVEQAVLAALAVFGATAHASHLLVAICLCAGLWLLWLVLRVYRKSSLVSARSFGVATAVILTAIVLQLAVNQRLFGQATLGGGRPPFLEAHIIAEGTGARYLHEHCAEHPGWALCHHLDNLSPYEDEFLWSATGIWGGAPPAEQEQLRREEMPFLLATLRAYPLQEFAVSLKNTWAQLIDFAIDDADNNLYMQNDLNTEIPNARAAYDRSLQARNALPEGFFTVVQGITVIAALLVIAAALPRTLRRAGTHRDRLLALTAVVLFVVAANAAVSGVLSAVDSRYQARIVWLLPVLAALYLLELPVFARQQDR